jgi:hypothetical protein
MSRVARRVAGRLIIILGWDKGQDKGPSNHGPTSLSPGPRDDSHPDPECRSSAKKSRLTSNNQSEDDGDDSDNQSEDDSDDGGASK